MTKPGTILEGIQIEDFAAESKCIAHFNGQVIFVKHAAPGDVVNLKIIRRKKNFLEAVPVQFHEYSDYRKIPFCEHYANCGGCQWQHIDYKKQLEFKWKQVKDQFERIGHFKDIEVLPVLGSEDQKFYRNKLEFTFSNRRWLERQEISSGMEFNRNGLGFHMPGRFDKVLHIHQCYLQDTLSNDIRNAAFQFADLKNILFYDLREHTGILRTLIIRNTSLGEWMVILQVSRNDITMINGILDHLSERFPQISSLYYIVNPKRNESYQDLEAILYSGRRYIREKMDDLLFHIGPKSFFQTNPKQAYRMYNKIREFAGININNIVYDLYCGTGSIALFIARYAARVIGFEYIREAVEDARLNAEINGIRNVSFYQGDIKDIISQGFIQQIGSPDVVITDPPRAGMHKDVIGELLRAAPGKIVYVSCNPATQARDINLLSVKYKPVKIQPVDMCPHTQHIENMVLLQQEEYGKL